MGTLLSLIFFASIFGIWYFWKRKPNKKYLISSIVTLILSTFLFSFTPEYKQNWNDVQLNLAKKKRVFLKVKN